MHISLKGILSFPGEIAAGSSIQKNDMPLSLVDQMIHDGVDRFVVVNGNAAVFVRRRFQTLDKRDKFQNIVKVFLCQGIDKNNALDVVDPDALLERADFLFAVIGFLFNMNHKAMQFG